MDHERCSELLLLHLRRELDPELAREVDEHLDACSDCRSEKTALLAVALAPVEPLTDLERASLRRDLRARLPAPAEAVSTRPRLTWLPQAIAVAAMLLVVVVGIQTLGGGGGDADSGGTGGSVEPDHSGAPQPVTLSLTRSGLRDAPLVQEAAGTADDPAASDEEEAEVRNGGDGAQDLEAVPAVEDALRSYARTSSVFTRFAGTYTAEDAPELGDVFVRRLADDAPPGIAPQLTECARLVMSSRAFPTLPAAAAHGRFRAERSLVLGFVWTPEQSGPLDNYALYVWPHGTCETPSHSQSGRIRTSDP